MMTLSQSSSSFKFPNPVNSTSFRNDQYRDSHDEGEASSSDDDGVEEVELDPERAKLNKLRRGARKRRTRGGRFNRLEKLQSFDAQKKAQALKRMEDGLRAILALHTPVELSSICGALLLKPQLKGATSIEQIISYALQREDFNKDVVNRIFSAMWEGALWEYLHSIGHPVHSIALDPRQTILQIWEQGGLLDAAHDKFMPHFIAREVKKRNEWISSPDIQTRVDQIRVAQEAAKKAEKRVISEHDYTNILTYFKEMSKLRSIENATREYLIAELETARSRIDSGQEVAKMLREQLKENEEYYMRIVQALNEEMAHSEHVCKLNVRRRVEMEQAVLRLSGVIDSYIETSQDRATPGGGGLQALKPREIESFPPSLKDVFAKLQLYREQRDEIDDQLRFRARSHIEEIRELRAQIEDLKSKLESMTLARDTLAAQYDRITYEHALLDRRAARTKCEIEVHTGVLWHQALRHTRKTVEFELQRFKAKPLLMAAACHSNPFVQKFSLTLLNHFRILTRNQEEYKVVLERQQMLKHDAEAFAAREAAIRQLQRDLARQGTSKKVKSSKTSTSTKIRESDKGSEDKAKAKTKKKANDDETTVDAKTVMSKSSERKSPSRAATPAKKRKK